MARTTDTAVKGIIDVTSGVDLTPFISVANELVTEVCLDSTPTTYDSTRLELIERWLAAHFYTNYEPRAMSEKAGDVAERKQDKVDLGLDSSFYGQTAMRLDTNGGLSKLNEQSKKGSKRTVGLFYVGTPIDEETAL